MFHSGVDSHSKLSIYVQSVYVMAHGPEVSKNLIDDSFSDVVCFGDNVCVYRRPGVAIYILSALASYLK